MFMYLDRCIHSARIGTEINEVFMNGAIYCARSHVRISFKRKTVGT